MPKKLKQPEKLNFDLWGFLKPKSIPVGISNQFSSPGAAHGTSQFSVIVLVYVGIKFEVTSEGTEKSNPTLKT